MNERRASLSAKVAVAQSFEDHPPSREALVNVQGRRQYFTHRPSCNFGGTVGNPVVGKCVGDEEKDAFGRRDTAAIVALRLGAEFAPAAAVLDFGAALGAG